MKILIVSTFFPPQNSIASLRPYSWAKYWSRMGHDVTVLTTKKTPHSSDSPMSFSGFSVISLPIPGLLEQMGAKLKRRAQLLSKQDNNDASPSDESIIFRAIFWLKRRFGIYSGCRMPEVADSWAKLALNEASKESWDLVISTAWPYSVHRVGYGLKKSNKSTYWVMDWRDLWIGNHMYPGLPIIRWWEAKLEQRFHSLADLVTTVSEPLAKQLRARVGNKVHVVFNGFDTEEYESLSVESVFPSDLKLRIVYTGSIYVGKQDPTPLFKAIKNLHDSGQLTEHQLQVIFVGLNADVIELAKRIGVDRYVLYQGLVPRERALRMQRDCNILLFLEYQAIGVDGILTGKLFEYLFAQAPILAVGVGSETSAGSIIEKSGRGVALGNDVKKIEQWMISIMQYQVVENKSTESLEISPLIGHFSRKNSAEKFINIVTKYIN